MIDRHESIEKLVGIEFHIEAALEVADGIVIFIGEEQGESNEYSGEEILLMTRDVSVKGSLKRNFIACRILVRRNSCTLNKKETVKYLDDKNFKAITSYEAFAVTFSSFSLYMGTASSSALDFICTYFRLLNRITVEDEEDKVVILKELEKLDWGF